MNKVVDILGSTGSIGTQALAVCEELGIQVRALAAGKNAALLEQQVRRFRPQWVCIDDIAAYETLKIRLADMPVHVLHGIEGMCEIASLSDEAILINAVVGMIGLQPTLRALSAGRTVALANKETLVAAGALVCSTASQYGGKLIPVDSEHSAIFQCLQGNDHKNVRRILLTASGGPFYGYTRKQLENVNLHDALKHPNWSMGAKITVDSSTLMNKGLEYIEAMWLFHIPPEQIEVVIHRESIVHSAVEYEDGCVMAQLSNPDMALPIQYALTYPQRERSTIVKPLDLFKIGKLTFAKPDMETFGCLKMAIEAAKQGGLVPCILNAANEAAVDAFLKGKIGFLDIERLVYEALEHIVSKEYHTLEEVLDAAEQATYFVNNNLL